MYGDKTMGFLKGYTKEEKSWMMYDWANSAESVIIVTILPIFYDTISANSTAAINRWGYGTSIAMLICALLAPFLVHWVTSKVCAKNSLPHLCL